MSACWLGVVDLAAELRISRRAATKLLSRSAAGHSWRGTTLKVREVHGRGGRSGLSYEVSLRSLSEALGGALIDVSEQSYTPIPAAGVWRATAPNQAATAAARWAVIEEAVQHAPGSAERRAAIKAAVERGTPEKTVRRWIKAYQDHGVFGLERKRPSNAGERRVAISSVFDKAFRARGYPEDKLAELVAFMEDLRKRVWKSPVQRAGEPEVRRHLEHGLGKFCGELGLDMPEAALRLSRRWGERDRCYSHVDVWKHDAKRFADGAPDIRRDLTKQAPMTHLVADVKHLDLVMRREDGSEAWPKIIAFQDRSTQRVFAYPLLLPAGEGVRQEHVIEAFIELACDPAWGFPQSLHLDNGSEFACFETIKSAFQLVNEEARKEIIYSIPYNARAKTVEGWFSRADQYLFQLFPGYAGRERMNKKTHKAGRPTIPYPHSFHRFKEEVLAGIDYINARPIGGQWGGRSADQVFAEKVGALGWRPLLADPLIMDAAFSRRQTLGVDRGAIRWKNARYTHEVLQGVATRTKLDVAISWRRGAPILFRSPDGLWSYARLDLSRDPDDVEGARDSGRRKRRYVKGAKALDAQVGNYDPLAAVREMAAQRQPASLPHSADRLVAESGLVEIAAARTAAGLALPSPAATSPEEAARRRREAEDELLARKYPNVA